MSADGQGVQDMDLDEEEDDGSNGHNRSEMSTALDSFYASLGIDEGSSSPSGAAAAAAAVNAAAGPSGDSSRMSSRSASPCGSPSPYTDDKERKKKKVGNKGLNLKKLTLYFDISVFL